MASATFTERRLFRNQHILQAFQSALGSPVDNFDTVENRVMWMKRVDFNPQVVKGDIQGTHGSMKKRKEGRYEQSRKPIVTMIGGATPRNIEWLLRAWGGSWTGTPTLTLGLTEEINEFVTLAIAEKTDVIPNPQNFIRIKDAWPHTLRLTMASRLSVLEVDARFIARDFDYTPLNALGGITLPSSFAVPEIAVFAPHDARLFRDPAGSNDSIAIERIELILEHGFDHETYNDTLPQIVKQGYTSVKIKLRSAWMDETYLLHNDALTQIPTFKRFEAKFTVGAKVFRMVMENVDWKPTRTGWAQKKWMRFDIEGEAYLDASDGYVLFELTP